MEDVDVPVEEGLTETEVWVRNPKLCIRECRDVHQANVVWNAGYVYRSGIDVRAFMDMHYGGQSWRVMEINYDKAIEYTSDDDEVIEWPCWTYNGDSSEKLQKMMKKAAKNGDRVIIREKPDTRTQEGRMALVGLAGLQSDFPDARMHVTDMMTFRQAFGMGFASADVDVRAPARGGRIMLPNGSVLAPEDAWKSNREWVRLLGFTQNELKDARKRCLYNLLAARWAGMFYRKNVLFRARGFEKIDPLQPVRPRVRKGHLMRKVNPKPGDYLACDSCSVSDACRFYRVGSVCTVPGSEGDQLAQMFKSTDSDSILEGLSELMAIGSKRLAQAVAYEEEKDVILTDTTKMLESLFTQGEKLAKLRNPALNGRQPAVPAGEPIQALTPAQLAQKTLDAFTAAGIPKASVTPDMVESVGEYLARGDNFEKAVSKVLRSLTT